MKAEIERRATLTDAVEQLFRSKPNTWLTMRELADVGGFGGWRTRVSECRRDRGMDIEQDGNGHKSRYRFRPQAPIGRDAGTPVSQPGLW
jgi:hypothetical protein